jgi:molybdopterin-guanine dinucleotide biosynthesis protein A
MAAVVLCGGESRRMGSAKGLIKMEGQPLVIRVAERMSAVARPVFLATGTPSRWGNLGLPEVQDVQAGAGPLAGIVAALEASPVRLLAVVAVDMPFASPEVFTLLAQLHVDEDAVVPVTAAGLEPLHAIYSRQALPMLRQALERGVFGLRSVLRQLRIRRVERSEWQAADPTGRFPLNLNSPADLSMLQ